MSNRQLQLQRPLVAFDLETTGLDVNDDRIVEMSCIKLHVDGRRETRTVRINPGRPIPEGATRIHGIRDADVAHEPSFADVAQSLFAFMSGSDLSGFNVEQFDLPVLSREFRSVGVTFPEPSVRVLDSWRIFLKKEPRDLAAALRFYCGRELTHAHSAEADAAAAADVLLAQVTHYTDLPTAVAELDAFCHPANADFVDRDGKLVWVGGEAALGFGKHKNRTLRSMCEQERGYLEWMAQKANFPTDVVRVIQGALAGEFPKAPGTAGGPQGAAKADANARATTHSDTNSNASALAATVADGAAAASARSAPVVAESGRRARVSVESRTLGRAG